ncbi:ATP-binding protein [Natronoarchaeum mannanilyticum]|uniref:histidine kinase n=1 Tax=Natronoarchaeum mannanilyticum TaxID=926360 RepID=A0AAV3T9J0_9EURY
MVAGRDDAEALGHAALNTLPLSVAVLDADGVIVQTNESWETFADENDLCGDSVGANYISVCRSDSDDEIAIAVADAIEAVLAGERDQFIQEYPCHSPTERRWFTARVSRFERDGDAFAVVAHADITQRKLAELAAESRAEELEAERDTLAFLNQLVRHDIRNDVTLVAGWAELLDDHVDEEGREFLDQIVQTTDHITELTRTAADVVAAMEDDDPDLRAIALAPVLDAEVRKAEAKHDREHQPVEFRLDDVPGDVRVRADDLLSSLFSNLLNNAVLHNDSAVPTVEVDVGVGTDEVTVTVADDGPGIPEDRRESIFGRGEKGIESPGTGVGLYLVAELAGRYGGTVHVEDSDLGGAAFVVTLRRA